MNYEYEIQKLQKEVADLRNAFLQSQTNQEFITYKVNNSAIKVDVLTPVTITKKVSIGDTEVTFNNVPNGNITVFVEDEDGNYPNYTMERNSNIITVYFEPSEYVTTVTLSIV